MKNIFMGFILLILLVQSKLNFFVQPNQSETEADAEAEVEAE